VALPASAAVILHTCSFSWDHALALARWLLGACYPSDVTVYLIEALDRTPGGELSEPARAGLAQVLALIRRESAFREMAAATGRQRSSRTAISEVSG
jgi:hypothetical protein